MFYRIIPKKIFVSSLLLIVLAFYPGISASQSIPVKEVMENGFKVVIEEDHSAPVVALQLWVGAGSADERDEEAGIAHLIEHMLFKGTLKRGVGDIAREIEEAGGDINAFTSYDNTVYVITIASRFFDRALNILSDMVLNSVFDSEELEREIQVVIEELKRGEDSPSSRLYKEVTSLAYTTHTYRRPVIGYKEILQGLTRDKVIDFYKRWYTPGNMTLVVVGDVEAGEILPAIGAAFKGLPSHPLPPRTRGVEPSQDRLKSTIITHEVKEANLELAFHIPGINSKETYALDILASILGDGRSSRLYRDIKDKKGLVRDISTYAMTPKDPGLFFVSADLESEKAGEAIEGILKVIEQIKREGPADDELERARLNLESSFIYQRETVQGKARQWGYFETIAGDLRFEERYLEGIKKVAKEDIKRAANRYLNVDNLTLGLLLPEKSKGLITKEGLKIIALKEVGSKEGELPIVKKVLTNGITLIIKENHSNPTVSIYGAFLGGLITEDKWNNGITNVVARMLTRGTERFAADEIALRIESTAGSISGYSGRNTFGLSGKFLSRFFDEGIQLYADILLNPTFPDGELKKVKTDILGEIKTEEDNLSRAVINLLDSNLYEGHPYSMNPLGTGETIERIGRKELLDYYTEYAVGSNMVLSIVGDVDTEDVIAKVDALFKEMRRGEPFKIKTTQRVEKPAGIKRVEQKKEREQAHIAVGFLGPSLKNDDRYPLEVLTDILSGMGGRLFVELRDKKGLAYVVTAFLRKGYDTGSFVLYMATSPENLDVSIEGIRGELRKVISEGVTGEELNKGKMSVIGNYEIGLQSNDAQASDMAINEILGFGYDEFKRYPERILKVSMDDIKRAVERYIQLDAYIIAIIKPQQDF